jgi:hypothetical protein
MALWGATDADESKPKWLTTAEKKEVFANASGWVVEAGSAMTGNDNTAAGVQNEVLVATGALATSLGVATITSVDWVTTVVDKSAGFTLSAIVRWNEAVTVATSNPTLAVTNSNAGTGSGRGPHTLVYTSGSGTNELTFVLVIGTADAQTNADDVLSIAAQSVVLASSSTIRDTGTVSNSELVITAGQGTAAGTLTVVA